MKDAILIFVVALVRRGILEQRLTLHDEFEAKAVFGMYGNLKENGRRTMIGLARFQSIYKLVLDADIIEKRRCVTEGLRWSLGGVPILAARSQ